MNEALYLHAFVQSPYRWNTVGFMADIQRITLDEARAYFHTYYAPNNAVLVLAGDVEPAPAASRSSSATSARIPRRPPPAPVDASEPPQDGERRRDVVAEGGGAAGRPRSASTASRVADPDRPALDVVERLLGGGESARLDARPRARARDRHRASRPNNAWGIDPELFYHLRAGRGRGRPPPRSRSGSTPSLHGLARDAGARRTSCAKAKNAAPRRARAGPQDRERQGEPARLLRGRVRRLPRARGLEAAWDAVTAEDVQRVVARRTSVPEPATGRRARARARRRRRRQRVRAAPRSLAARARRRRRRARTSSSCRRSRARRSRTGSASSSPSTTSCRSSSSTSSSAPARRRTRPGKEGVAALTARRADARRRRPLGRGAGARDRVARRRRRRRRRAPTARSSAPSSSPRTSRAGSASLRDVVLAPRFARDEVRRARDEQVAGIVAALEEPSAVAEKCFAAFLYGAHPYGRPVDGRIATRAGARPRRRARLLRRAGTARTTRSSCSSATCTPDEALARLREAFGGWQPRPDAVPVARAARRCRSPRGASCWSTRPTRRRRRSASATSRSRGTIPTTSRRTVANTILGGGFTSQLIEELRVKRSLTYCAWSTFVARLVGGDFRRRDLHQEPDHGRDARARARRRGRLPQAAARREGARRRRRRTSAGSSRSGSRAPTRSRRGWPRSSSTGCPQDELDDLSEPGARRSSAADVARGRRASTCRRRTRWRSWWSGKAAEVRRRSRRRSARWRRYRRRSARA